MQETGVSQYLIIELNAFRYIYQHRHYGHSSNSGTGRFRLYYWDLATDAWVAWSSHVAFGSTDAWGAWETLTKVRTNRIKLEIMTVDGGAGYINELEVKY